MAQILFHLLKLLHDLGLEESHGEETQIPQKYIVVEKNRGLLRLETVSFAFQFKEGGGVFGGDQTEFWEAISAPKRPQSNTDHDEENK